MKKYKLTFIHSLLSVGLLITAVFLFCQPQAYKIKLEYAQDNDGFSFLQRGDYVLDIYYDGSPAENEIVIYSDEMVDDRGCMGNTFLSVEMNEGSGRAQVKLTLEQDSYNVRLKTGQDTEEHCYINLVALQSIQLQNKDNYLLGLLCVMAAAALLVLGWRHPLESYREYLALLGLGLLASMPLFSGVLINGDDLGYHVARLEAVYRGIRAGEFPVYLGTGQMGDFGTLSATMYPQLFLYPFALLRLGGISLMLCYKLLVVCLNIGTAFTAYISVKKLCQSSKIAFWASVMYTFSIYRLVNVYFRAALGESLAMVFLPLVIWGIYEVLWGDYKKWYVLALGVGGILQSHVLSVEMSVLFLVIEVLVWLFSRGKTAFFQRILAGGKAAVVTVLVNAFFLVPFLFFCGENLQCFKMPNQLSESGVYFSQLFSVFAVAAGEEKLLGSTIEEMPHTIGFILLLGMGLFLAESAACRREDREMKVGKRCLIYGAAAILMSSWLFPWDLVQRIAALDRIASALQFSWRFLGLASVFLSVVSGIGLVRFAERLPEYAWVYGVFALLTVCSTSFFFGTLGQCRQYQDKMVFSSVGYTDAMYMYSESESYEPYNLAYDRKRSYMKTRDESDVNYYEYERNGIGLRVRVENKTNAEDYLIFPLHYYPGYEILIDGEKTECLKEGRQLACKMPMGTTLVEVSYKGLPAFRMANWVSLFSVLGILGYMLGRKCGMIKTGKSQVEGKRDRL